MKKVYFIVGLVVIAALIIYFKNNTNTLKPELSDFAFKDTASIGRLFLADQYGKSVTLDRVDNGWVVNGKYKVRKDLIDHLLETISRVSIKSPVSKSKFETVVKRLSSRGVKIEIYVGDSNEPEKVYYVGKSNQEYSGTYMLLEGSSVPFLMHLEGFRGYLTPRYNTNINEWREKNVFKAKAREIKTLTLTDHQVKEKSFSIEFIGNDLMLKNHQGDLVEMDTNRVRTYLNMFSNVNYEGFEETKDSIYIDSVKNSQPLHTISLSKSDGTQTSISTYLKPNNKGANDAQGIPFPHDMDRLYGLIDRKDFVIIQYNSFDPITKPLSYFQ
jgi:hypothetical protein